MLEKHKEQGKQHNFKIERIKYYKSLLYSVNEKQDGLNKQIRKTKGKTSKLSNLESFTLRKEKGRYHSNTNYIRFLTRKIYRIESL
jgi:hypothetical protein